MEPNEIGKAKKMIVPTTIDGRTLGRMVEDYYPDNIQDKPPGGDKFLKAR